MEKYLQKIKSTGIFQGFDSNEIALVLKCLAPSFSVYDKGQCIMLQGVTDAKIGIIIDGKIKLQREDINGNTVVFDELSAGDIFGYKLSISKPNLKFKSSIWSYTKAVVAFIDYSRILSICPSDCPFHRRLIINIVDSISNKLTEMSQKIYILQNNSIRRKLMAYFECQKEKTDSNTFTIPFSRSELAEYIGVNRSAMSRELYNMLEDGLIKFKGNTFQILY